MSSSDCPICLGSFQRPVLASCCGQSFCRSCLDDALRQADACPMCRSPLLSGPFSVAPNRALEEALASASPTSEKPAVTSFVDAVERKLARTFASQVRISVANTTSSRTESEDGREPLTGPPRREQEQEAPRWSDMLGLCRSRCQHHRRWVSVRHAELRRRLRQWQLWCRVNWTSLQCVFYVLLFFVFVFFLRVQEEEFAESTGHLRRPN